MHTRKLFLAMTGIAVAASASTVLALKAVAVDDRLSPQADIALADKSTHTASHGLVKIATSSAGVPTDFTAAAESTIDGVVSIKSYVNRHNRSNNYYRGNGQDFFNDPFFEFFFGQPRRQQPERRQDNPSEEEQQQQLGLGSGVILTADGYIVTNNHVINGADKLEVTLNDNSTYNATVVGNDEMTDLALIKIDASNLPVIPMGDSDALRVGEWVLAVGNPFGLTSTVTSGIVSAKARSISDATHSRSMGVESYIQTDAAVNPGNSGGALVNLRGELVGINTAIYSQTGNYAGHSFAIPTAIVNKIVGDLREYGAVQRAFLGISFRPLDAKLAKEKGITATNSGIYVAEVQPNSAAAEAGLREGDVITAINAEPTRNEAQLRGIINRYSPGDEVSASYIRNNEHKVVRLKLLNQSGSTKITRAGDSAELGCTFGEPAEETLHQLRLSSGVEVKEVGDGLFKSAGIKKGYIITSINQQTVRSAKDIEALYKQAMQSDTKALFIMGVYPTGKRTAYAVNLDD
ncbi:MAG: Do family serine endopeptidase [Candidatus Amulumruptor caecigallinarius]|nr:Do family serine endopeptidase [Candidatus Amulumruptor caecigallinarius]MCM1396237.1 Do family serine endopeptidase [Candidatus Amulumruptor caecigallinarius]MCM1453763.1 Do family serine endopeptidase [bacterium]